MLPTTESQTAPIRILVVEDEPIVRNLLADELRGGGFLAIEAAHAEEALTYLRSGGEVDLVFTDIQMPGALNGLDLARLLREQYPSLPIILTSGTGRPRGADAFGPFIPKPYDTGYVASVVRDTLGLGSTGEGAPEG
jgi:CheY-like chemotaxis protein